MSSPLSPSLPQLRSASTYPPHRARCSHRTDPVPPMPLYAPLLPRARCSHRTGPVPPMLLQRICSTAFHTAPPVSLTHSPRATTSVPTTPPASTHPLLDPRPTCQYLRLHPPPSPPHFSLACWRRGREAGAATERALPPTVDIVDSACWPRLLKSKRAILDEPGWGAQVYLFSDQCVLPCCEQPRRTCVHTRLSQVASDMSRSTRTFQV